MSRISVTARDATARELRDISSMIFDAAVYLVVMVAVIAGFNAGFLRSMATILGYLAAMPIAAAAMSMISPALAGQSVAAPWAGNLFLLFGIFLITGIVLGSLLRRSISAGVGERVSIVDRLAGSGLGAARALLVAVLMVLIFDRIIPASFEPAFLHGSQLRPILSMAAQQGLKSLPPEATEFIERLKHDPAALDRGPIKLRALDSLRGRVF
jgi:membrane protein required for colicin V production